MSTANRGKVAEGLLTKQFEKLSASRADFTFERIYDARSSLGSIANPRSGDFVLYFQGKNVLLEVKEVAHDYRLPVGNFKLDQRARLRIRSLAGTVCAVAVYHTTTKSWRLLPASWFGTLNQGSWDLRPIPSLTLVEVIHELVNNTEALCH